MAKLTFNAIDVETANRTRASICQIGIAQVQVGKIKRAASFLVNPEEPFESFQVSLHGINEEAVSEAETMLSIHPKLYRLIERAPLAPSGSSMLTCHLGTSDGDVDSPQISMVE